MTDRDNHPDSPPSDATKPDDEDVERALDNNDAAQRGETKNQGSDGQ